MTRVTYARARRKLADPLTSGHGPEARSPVPNQTGLREDYFHCEEKMFLLTFISIAIVGAIPLPLHPLRVEKHKIRDRSNERQVRNTSIDQPQQAEHSGILMEDRFQIQRWNRYTDPHAGAHEKEW
jgi:hypothetical protein